MNILFRKNDDSRQSKETTGVKYNSLGSSVHSERKQMTGVPSLGMILLLAFYLLLCYWAQVIEDEMPSVVLESSLPANNSDTFSEEIALRYLNEIVGDGPRVAGTTYHLKKTKDLKKIVDRIAADSNIPITTDWQMASGGYILKTKNPFFNMYRNCSNVIALLEGENGFHSNGTLGSSLLVNCHYDSVPFAKGASDNAVFCAIMAESLAILSKRTNKLKHNVVFLFNGAEENPLQATHAFLQHPWAQSIFTVVNVDAAGMNGKPCVFQVTDLRVLNAYGQTANSPTAQGLAEYIFQSGVVPSNTDYRIFKEFANLSGIDIAFTKWGHVYHTRNDIPELLREGVLQGAGDMLLALIRQVADSPEIVNKIPLQTEVYYDFLHVILLRYSFSVAYVVDEFIIILGFASVAYYLWLVGLRWSSVKDLLWTCLGRMLGTLIGVVVTTISTFIMVATTVQMRYLSQAWIVIPQFWLPFGLASVATSQAYDAWRSKKSGLCRSLRALQAMAATRLLMSIVAVLVMGMPSLIVTRYCLTVPLFLMSVTSLISTTIIKYIPLSGLQHLVLEALMSIPVALWTFSEALRIDSLMLPVMGRSSSDTPDYKIAMFNIALSVLFAMTVSGIELLFSRKRLWLVLSAVGIPTLILIFMPFSPYQDYGVVVQRHYWFHTEFTTFGADGNPISNTSGIFATKQDPYSIDDLILALRNAGYKGPLQPGFGDNCTYSLYCGMPIYKTSFTNSIPNGLLVPTKSAPTRFSPAADFSLNNKSCSEETCTYNFTMTGGPHNMVTLWPYSNVTLESWSLEIPVKSSYTQLERPVYVISYAIATYTTEWNYSFSLVFHVPKPLQSNVIMEVSHHSHRLYQPEDFTDEYKQLIQAMPKYFNIAAAMSFRYNYVF